MNITDLLTGGLGSKAIAAVANLLGVSETKAKWIIAAAVPLMIAALNYNAKKKDQEESISNALDKHKDVDFEQLSDSPSADGEKIVSNIFGKNTTDVTENIAEKTGFSTAQIGGVLATLAPFVLSYLGKQKQSNTSGGGIGDLIGSVLGAGASSGTSGGGIGAILGSIFGGDDKATANPETTPATTQASGADAIGDLVGDFFNKNNDKSTKGGILDKLAGMFGN